MSRPASPRCGFLVKHAGLRREVFTFILCVITACCLHRQAAHVSPVLNHSAKRSEIPVDDHKRTTFHAAALTTGGPEPAATSMVAAAFAMPPVGQRNAAFYAALENWILNDPEAAAGWIIHLADPRDFDRGAALLVIHTDTLQRPTALALTWAEDLADPALRRCALLHVLREWSQENPSAALRYAGSAPSLSPEERAALLAALAAHPTET